MTAQSAPVAEISLQQARCLQLAALGLLQRPRRRASMAALLDCIGSLGMLQIDTINVVARSPYLVLYSRLGDYPAHWLDQALADGDIGESWAHEACFVPSAELPWHRAHVQSRRRHWAWRMAQRHLQGQAEAVTALLQRIERDGALRAADVAAAPRPAAGWWQWRPEKRLLEACFVQGELMVARRERFQRVYDLPQRVLRTPALLAAWREPPSPAAVRARFIEAALVSLGIARVQWLADYFRLDQAVDAAELSQCVAPERLLPVRVQGLEGLLYVHGQHQALLQAAVRGELGASHCTLLSPFDPLLWDRRRAAELFDFDYRLECYLPAASRRHGYFVLPLLVEGRLLARVDAKAHRREGVFEIRSLHLEPGWRRSKARARRIHSALLDCARWHGTPQLVFAVAGDADWLLERRGPSSSGTTA